MPPYDDLLFVPRAPVARIVVRHPERQQSLGEVEFLRACRVNYHHFAVVGWVPRGVTRVTRSLLNKNQPSKSCCTI